MEFDTNGAFAIWLLKSWNLARPHSPYWTPCFMSSRSFKLDSFPDLSEVCPASLRSSLELSRAGWGDWGRRQYSILWYKKLKFWEEGVVPEVVSGKCQALENATRYH